MSGFVATAPVPPATDPQDAIENDGWFPSLSIAATRNAVRLDGTVTPERLRAALVNAMLNINRQLRGFKAERSAKQRAKAEGTAPVERRRRPGTENVDIRPEFDFVTGDLSFISLTLVLPAVVPFLAADGDLLVLVKPQFELQPGQVGKGGIVREEAFYGVVEQRLRDRDMGIVLTDAAKTLIAKRGFDPVLGARPLRRALQRDIEDILAEKILFGDLLPGHIVVVDVAPEGSDLPFTFVGQPRAELPDHAPAALASGDA